MSEGTRLNKFLASCGVASRRACDDLVKHGRVEINGKPCLNPAESVLPSDFVKVDGRRVSAKPIGTIVLNKPRGFVVSKDDELGRDTILTLLPGHLRHLNHVGRLDRDSEGLLILTNEGSLAQALLHPSKSIEKEYIVTANQPVSDPHLDQFLIGLFTEEGKLKAKEIERLSPRRIRVVLTSGQKRQIRVMFKTLGYNVQRLVRVRIGSFELTDVPPGKWRALTPAEIDLLLRNPEGKMRVKARRVPKPIDKRALKSTARKSAKKAAKKAARPAPKASLPPKKSTRNSREKPGRNRKF